MILDMLLSANQSKHKKTVMSTYHAKSFLPKSFLRPTKTFGKRFGVKKT